MLRKNRASSLKYNFRKGVAPYREAVYGWESMDAEKERIGFGGLCEGFGGSPVDRSNVYM